MIQRVQSLLLSLVALFYILLFFIPVFSWSDANAETTYFNITALYNIPCIIVNVLIILLSILTIFRFKHRKQQRSFVYFLSGIIVLNICLYMYYMFQITALNQYTLSPIRSIGIYLQLISLILCFLAAKRIKKDDDLVKSVDRIR